MPVAAAARALVHEHVRSWGIDRLETKLLGPVGQCPAAAEGRTTCPLSPFFTGRGAG